VRVMMTVFPTRTHIYSIAPVGWALRAAGHEVRYVGPRNPFEVSSFLETGQDPMWAGDDLDIGRHRKLEVDGGNSMDSDIVISESRPERFTPDFIRTLYRTWTDIFGWAAPESLLDEMLRFARRWKPDLVVWDPMMYAGPLVARAVGAAHVRMIYAADQTARLDARFRALGEPEDPFVDWASAWLERVGSSFDDSLRMGMASIDSHPRCLHYPEADVDYWPTQFVPVNRPLTMPPWALEKLSRPRVLLTLGVSNRQVYGIEETSVSDLLDGLADLDVDVIATLNASQLASVEKVPDNVRAVDFVPMNEVLATCSAIVHQGGGATICNAAVNGVPQLIVPGTTWSERDSALALEKYGNGLILDLHEVTPGAVRAKLDRLLGEPSFGQAAARLRAEMASAPTLGEIVPRLEALAGPR
jgi:hypothetical protein